MCEVCKIGYEKVDNMFCRDCPYHSTCDCIFFYYLPFFKRVL